MESKTVRRARQTGDHRVGVRTMPTVSEGVVYVAFGRPFLMMALNSAASLRASNPSRGITIVTNLGLDAESVIPEFRREDDDWVHIDQTDGRNRLAKTSANEWSRYDRTLLLDADSVVLRPLDIPFRLLGFADVLLKLDPKGQTRPWQRDEEILDIGPMGDIPAWNGGVIFFRRGSATRDFFSRWRDAFNERGSEFDQPALVEAVLTTRARVLALDTRWNSPVGPYQKSGGTDGPTRLLHYMRATPDWVRRDVLALEQRLVRAGHLEPSSETLQVLDARRLTSTISDQRRSRKLLARFAPWSSGRAH